MKTELNKEINASVEKIISSKKLPLKEINSIVKSLSLMEEKQRLIQTKLIADKNFSVADTVSIKFVAFQEKQKIKTILDRMKTK
jgi:hypothetical protein